MSKKLDHHRRTLAGTHPLKLLPFVVFLVLAAFPPLSNAAYYCLSYRYCEPGYYLGGDGSSGQTGTLLSVALSSPSNGSSVTGTVTVNATIDGVKKNSVDRVEFFVDGNHFATDSDGQPFRASWNTLDPNLPSYDGTHQLTAMAYDANGRASSPAVNVTVANTAGTKYRATFTSTEVPLAEDFDPNAATQQVHPVDVTITNTSSYAWSPTYVKLYYRWFSPDPTATIVNGTAVSLGTTMNPGTTRTLRVNVLPPNLPNGVSRAQYKLRFDLHDSATAAYFAARGNAPLENPVIINKAIVANALGLERFYHYQGEEVGAGMKHLLNVASGNSILRWSPWSSPGRGLATVLDLTYNALEKKSESPLGNNWSLSISGLSRFGNPIDIHPNKADEIAGRSNRFVDVTDGDGTPHRFVGKVAADGTVYWEEPAGVHLYLRSLGTTDPARRWAFTRPDRVTFYYDADGYPTSVEDKNGNRITFTLETTPPADDPGGPKRRIAKVTDAGGRSFAIDYYTKAEVKKPRVRGKVEAITDHEGHAIVFDYYEDGNLLRITQEGGQNADGSTLANRTFVFTYTVSNGSGPAIPLAADRASPNPQTPNQSTRLYSVRDPRGKETIFSYHLPANANDWKLATRTDRAGVLSRFDYDIVNRVTTFTAPLSRISRYGYDTDGKVTSITNPKGETTSVTWSADRHVTAVTAANGTTEQFTYNANGYLTSRTDQLGNRTALTYQNVAVDANDASGKWKAGRSIPHVSQLATKTSPRGTATATVGDFQWTFAYDAKGNLTTATDPLGKATSHAHNPDGTVAQTTDANGRVTRFAYDANGLVSRLEKPNGSVTQFGYDADGLLRWLQDPNHANDAGTDVRAYRTYFDYDSFHRFGRQSAPKSTSLERGTLVWSATQYDPNDNVTRRLHPQLGASWPGTVSTTVRSDTTYDAMDRVTEMRGPYSTLDPQDERTRLTYDAAGRMTRATLPEGVKSATVNDWTVDYVYDTLDRVVSSIRYPLDGASAGARRTHFCFDVAGDMRWVTSPRASLTTAPTNCGAATPGPPAHTRAAEYDAAHQLVTDIDAGGRRTTYTYDADGNRITETDPRGTTLTTEYDARDRRTKQIQPFKTGKSLTQIWEYDNVGNVSREITPRAFDAAGGIAPFSQFVRRFEYDGADQLTRILEPTSTKHPQQHYIHNSYDPNGNLLWTSLPVTAALPGSVTADQRSEMTYFDTGWIRTNKEPGRPRIRFDYTAEGLQKERVVESNAAKTIRWEYFADGLRKSQTDADGQPTTYAYDANNNLVEVDDRAGGTNNNERRVVVKSRYNGFSEVTKVSQQKDGAGNWKVTLLDYDANGNLKERTDNREETNPDTGTVATGSNGQPLNGRRHVFTYNESDWLTQQEDFGTESGCGDDRRIVTTYLANGWESQRQTSKKRSDTDCTYEVRQRTNWTYFLTKQIQTLSTRTLKNGVLTELENHNILYEDGSIYVGHKTRDTFFRGEAGKPCGVGTPCTQTWEYDARDRLVNWSNGKDPATAYTLDPAGNITRETTSVLGIPVTIDYTYTANQLRTVAVDGALRERWWYQDGNVDCVTSSGGSQANCPTPGGLVLRDYHFDALDRMELYRAYAGSSAPTDSANYYYDPLDRLARQTETHNGTGSRTTEFDYIGLTNQTAQERYTGSTGSYRNDTKRYSYDAWGRLTGMQNETATGTKTDYNYGIDDHGSVSLLVDQQSGNARATYGYRPYGELDEDQSDGDKGPAAAKNPLNPFRYTSHRYDSGSGDIDMGSRRFSPGAHRFYQQDVYMGALEDLSLTLDPLTQNRYALTGANPVGFVEVDGHFGLSDIANAVSDAADFVSDHAHTALDVCGLVPVVGSACDLANAGLYAAEGDWGNAALSAVGAIPIAGDVATAGKLAAKYGDEAVAGLKAIGRNSDEAADVVRGGDKLTGARSAVRSGGRSQADIVKENYRVGTEAEQRIARSYPGSRTQVTRQAKSGTRRIDVLTPQGRAIESKVGRTSLTDDVERQIRRDLELLADPKSGVKSLEWRFSRSPRTGRIGPTAPLAERLRKAGIRISFAR